jgi:hypothetical protein
MFDIQEIYVFIYFSITIYTIMWGGGWMVKVLGYDWGGECSNPTLGRHDLDIIMTISCGFVKLLGIKSPEKMTLNSQV